MKDIQPRIYVASLADYNAGKLHGLWIDADQDAEDIEEEVAEMLKASTEPGAEEWAIHDYEYIPRIGESSSWEEVAAIGKAVAEHGEAFIKYASYLGDLEYALETFEEAYCGEFDTPEDYAVEYCEMTGVLDAMPEELRSYFDYAAFARDMFCGTYTFIDGYVFCEV